MLGVKVMLQCHRLRISHGLSTRRWQGRQVGSAKAVVSRMAGAARFCQDVRLELHQKLVAGSTAIHFQGGDGLATSNSIACTRS